MGGGLTQVCFIGSLGRSSSEKGGRGHWPPSTGWQPKLGGEPHPVMSCGEERVLSSRPLLQPKLGFPRQSGAL